jgi:hypothetical protein
MGVALRLLIDASKIAILLTQGHWRRPCLMRLPRDSHTVNEDFGLLGRRGGIAYRQKQYWTPAISRRRMRLRHTGAACFMSPR